MTSPFNHRKGESWKRMRPEVTASLQRVTPAVLTLSFYCSLGWWSSNGTQDSPAGRLSGFMPHPAALTGFGSAWPCLFITCSFSSCRPPHKGGFTKRSSLTTVSKGSLFLRPPRLIILVFPSNHLPETREFCFLSLSIAHGEWDVALCLALNLTPDMHSE